MSHGRIGIVLGAHAGLGGLIHLCEGIRQGKLNHSGAPASSSVATVVTQLIPFDKNLRREGASVLWSAIGADGAEVGRLLGTLDALPDGGDVLDLDALTDQSLDVLLYVPLDAPLAKQVEHLARLAMVLPRVRHIAFAPTPQWNHSQLMALRETWQWMDPRQTSKLHSLSNEILGPVRAAQYRARAAAAAARNAVPHDDSIEPLIITRSPRMKEILTLVDAVADTDSTVLVTGDSGTGKELIAQRIHCRSHRRHNPLVAVNCGAIPAELLESDLFGHMKGAFTGAVSNREGRFEAAQGGTLFLDEIGEMGPNLQVKLLRVLQMKRYEPVGSTKSKTADARIIAATNRDLEEDVRDGRFREDLYYRLNVIPVHVPGLRERPEDIGLLVDHFIRKFNRDKGRRVTGVTRASLRALIAYDWPGNVRELENLMERMVILKSSGMIDVLDFPDKFRRKSLSEIEFDDLMNASKTVAINTAAPSAPAMEESGENSMTSIKPGTFTKSRIEQGIPSSATGMGDGGLNGHAESYGASAALAPASIDSPLSVEQAIRLIADRMQFPNEGLDFNSVVDQFENILILQALERTGWNRNRAAMLLRLNRTTLVEKLKKKQLVPPLRDDGSAILEGNA
jgi:transcriptional regulator with PAS, ATPase and Fis domain